MFKKILSLLRSHKFISLILIGIIIGGVYFTQSKLKAEEVTTRYVTAAAEKGTLITSVSGSGQVSATDQVDITPKISGDITTINIKNGQEVKSGDLLVSLDSRDVSRDIRDAETDLETARLELEELLAPIDELDLLQAENSVTTAKRNLEDAEDDYEQIQIDSEQTLVITYEDAYSEVSDAFLKLPDHMNDLQDVLGTEDNTYEHIGAYELILGDKSIFIDSLLDDYETALDLYNDNFDYSRTVSRSASRDTIYSLLSDTFETTKAVSEALESARNMYDDIVTHSYSKLSIASVVNEMRPKIQSDISGVNSIISSLQNAKDTIDDTVYQTPIDLKNAEKDIEAAKETLAERELTLKQLKAGPDSLDIRAKEIAIKQREDALTSARQDYADHFIYAPFDGVVAETNVKKGDSVSASTNVATLITDKRLAVITLNEVDIAKVEVGQKANIAFDAVEDITVTGEVVEVDAIGTTSQGVVSYDVTISFDIQDERIKPGMSVSVDAITEVRPNVIMVSNSAVKSQGNMTYVEILANEQPRRQVVETGLSNDTMTEIVSGLEENQAVITQTINATAGQNTGSNSQGGNSILPTGGRGFGGGGFR
jgi:HlyD family secretion protein